MKNIVVLGSGIQGMCAAFALDKKGYTVTLIERDSELFSRSSRNQEGRVHMGFTYGLDKSGETGNAVMNNSLHFSELLDNGLVK